MKIILFFLLILLFFYIIGSFFLLVIDKKNDITPANKNLIAPVIGVALCVCVSQLANMFVSAKTIGMAWVIFVICALAFGIQKFKANFGIDNCNKVIIVVDMLVVLVLTFPLAKGNELLSLQYANNDIIYYLSTMDWLQEHSALQHVQFSGEMPYYLCAQYILKTTRYGTEVVGSVIMWIFNLEAHEVFSLLGGVYVVLTGHVVLYCTKKVFNIPLPYGVGITAISVFCFSWKELLVKQYVPQILGISLFMAFLTFIIDFYLERKKIDRILVSLFLVSTVSVYAELSSYIFIIFIGIILIEILYTKKFVGTIKSAFIIGAESILFNLRGFWIAVKFNLNILAQVRVSKDSIDAFFGNIKTKTGVITSLFGGPDVPNISTNVYIQKIYEFVIIFGVVAILAGMIFLAVKKCSKRLVFIYWICGFLGIYEIYFHKVRLAYGEYKHLLIASIPILCFASSCVFELGRNQKYKICFWIMVAGILACNMRNYHLSYPDDNLTKYNALLIEAGERAERLPAEKTLGILGNQHFIQHELIYATKNRKVQLMGEGVNSYYVMLGIPLNNEWTDYVLCMSNEAGINDVAADVHKLYKEIWNNGTYKILEKTEEE